jgi:hypothetical protein
MLKSSYIYSHKIKFLYFYSKFPHGRKEENISINFSGDEYHLKPSKRRVDADFHL